MQEQLNINRTRLDYQSLPYKEGIKTRLERKREKQKSSLQQEEPF